MSNHGAERAGLITASIAKTIMRGSDSAWETLISNLWSDDGEDFATAVSGARGHGHQQEPVGRGKFWERNPQYELYFPEMVHFQRRGYSSAHQFRRLLACSPDAGLLDARTGKRVGGLEVKSPVERDTFVNLNAEVARRNVPFCHVDQVRFSIWCTGWDCWYYVIHHGEEDYCELRVENDDEQEEWVRRFIPRVTAFIDQYLAGKKAERDKLGAGELLKLFG